MKANDNLKTELKEILHESENRNVHISGDAMAHRLLQTNIKIALLNHGSAKIFETRTVCLSVSMIFLALVQLVIVIWEVFFKRAS